MNSGGSGVVEVLEVVVEVDDEVLVELEEDGELEVVTASELA